MVRKNQFKPGDLGVYFEIDSKVPEKEPFMFLEAKHFRIKTQKYKTPNGQFWSQGLLMSFEDFGWETNKYEEGTFLTKELEVIYSDADDNKRKSNSMDKYKLMAQRRGKLFSKQPFRWLMKRTWGRKLLFVFFGKKRDKRSEWPAWVVKTDEERCQNLPHLFPGDPNEKWIATEKIDGTSTTFTMRGKGRKRKFYVCSRNVVFDKPDKKCFYETNVYTEMAEKYDMESVLSIILDSDNELDFVTIQGETFGPTVQKRDYHLIERELRVFNVIFGYKNGTTKRLNPVEMKDFMDMYNIPTIPIVNTEFVIPATCEELLEMCGGPSAIDEDMREGLVFRSLDGTRSFKAVDNNFLLKYHG